MSNLRRPPGQDSSRRTVLAGAATLVAASALTSPVGATDTWGSAAPTRARSQTEMHRMNSITTRDGTLIAFKDWGSGQPVVFSHG